jgi:hypothetical protein
MIRAWLPIPWGGPSAGRWSFVWRGFGVHLLPGTDFWGFGLFEGWYDGPLCDLRLGPLLLVSWQGTACEALAQPSQPKNP